MSMHIVAKFICAVCLALELDFPRMFQQWMRGPWREQTPHSCWHWGCQGTAHTEQEVAPTYLAVLREHGATGNLAAPIPSNDSVSFEGWGPASPVARLRNEHLEQREMRKKTNRLWLPCQYQQLWRNPLTCWFGKKGLQGEECFSFV